ncbi:MAG: hypothetical protein M0R40_06655 [Firmicutes bacterium]|nr:hypothetical protein [Bacillota bacterium]
MVVKNYINKNKKRLNATVPRKVIKLKAVLALGAIASFLAAALFFAMWLASGRFTA